MDPQVAAAASGILPLLTGPSRPGRVLGSHRAAVIVAVPSAAGRRLVSVLGPSAAGVPNGVRLTDPVDLTWIAPGTNAFVGDRRVRAGALEVRVVRSWDSAIRPGRPVAARVQRLSRAAADARGGVPPAAVAALRKALAGSAQASPGTSNRAALADAALADAALADAVDGLVGLGQGSTPGGDDVLAGLIAGLHATGGRVLVGTIAARLNRLPERTTALSADLLWLAVRGHACLEALDVLRMVSGSGAEDAYTATVSRLLSIGHTSGADLATGLAIGLSVGMARPSLVDSAVTVPTEAECQGPR